MTEIQQRITDLEVMKAIPVNVSSFDINHYIMVDFLNLNFSKPFFKNKVKTSTGYEKEVKRKLIFSCDNGKQVEVGIVTIRTKKTFKMKDVSFMISYNPSNMIVDQVKKFISEDTNKNLSILEKYRKLRKTHNNEDRLMAVITSHGKKQLVTADSREDFKRLASKDRTLSYKIVSEKFGFNFSKSIEKIIKTNYPSAKLKKIRKKVEEFFKHNHYDYKKMAKWLTGKSKTKNADKIFAKRLLSKICGDRIWMSGV